MSDVVFPASQSEVGSAQEVAPGLSAGALLRQAREAAGLHVSALAGILKVPVNKLEALEADRWDLLPDNVFARALAASVCRTLKVDPAPVLERLPQNSPRLSPHGDGINEPFQAPYDAVGQGFWSRLSRPAILAVLALLLGALVLIFLPVTPSSTPTASVDPRVPGAESAPVPMPVSPAAVPGPAPLIVAETTAHAALAASSSAPLPQAGALPVPGAPATAVASPPAGVASATPPALPVAQVAVNSLVTFSATADSWIKVTDARGTVLLSKMLTSGETAGASGTLPLTVVVGRADATRVQVRGQSLDLQPLSRDNVARFEVK